MNKKRKILVIMKIILIIFLIYVDIISGKEIYLGDFQDKIVVVFGVINSLFIPYIVLSIFSDFVGDNEKKAILNLRVFFSFVFLMFLFNLQFLHYVEGFPEEHLEKSVFIYFYTKKHLGILFTMLYYNFYFLVPFNINLAITGVILFFSSIILFGKIIGNSIRIIANYFSKENREKRKEIKRLILENKKIRKKILEKEKIQKAEKIKRNKIEAEKKKLREEKIIKLREELKLNKKTKVTQDVKLLSPGKQLHFDGIESIEEIIPIIPIFPENEESETKINKNQLYFDFDKKEVL